MNNYTQELISDIQNRYSIESTGMTTGEWICANTTVRGRPFSFDKYRFQRAIADDLHPELDVMKISQVGLTEVQARKALSLLVRNSGLVGIFSLPNEIMYKRFSQLRLQPMVSENRVFNGVTDEDSVRSMAVMQFGRSFLNVVHVVEASATSISADFVFNDEVDLSDQKTLALFSSRLQNSELKIRQRFSTPSWTGFGIDATYGASDQREYMCRCYACNHWQLPLFDRRWVTVPGLPENLSLSDVDDEILAHLDLADATVVCERCHSPLDLDSEKREWVAVHPSRQHARGYRVRPFSSGRLSVEYILRQLVSYKRKDFMRGWYNTVLGEPFTDSNSRLDEGQIRRCFGQQGIPEISSGAPVFLGIDIGQTCHLMLGTPTSEGLATIECRAVRIHDLISTVEDIATQYNLVHGACDRYPYTPTAEEIRDVTQGRVMPFEYRGDAELKPVKTMDDRITHWQVNRTKLLDDAARLVRKRAVQFNGYGMQGGVLLEHLRDMVRDENPEKEARWVKLTGNDHYFHAFAFLNGSLKLGGALDLLNTSETRETTLIQGLGPMQARSLINNPKSKNKFIRSII